MFVKQSERVAKLQLKVCTVNTLRSHGVLVQRMTKFHLPSNKITLKLQIKNTAKFTLQLI